MDKSSLNSPYVDDYIDDLIPKVNSYIGKITSIWYKHPYYITNPVLSRNMFTSNFFQKLVEVDVKRKNVKFKLNTSFLTIQIIKYFLKSLIHFTFFLLHFLCFKLSKLGFRLENYISNDGLVAIDTFTMIDRIYGKRKFEDNYFVGLYDLLDRSKKQYIILTILFGDRPWNLKRRFLTYNILAQNHRKFVTEFDLLKFLDYLRLLYFIVIYPFLTLKLLNINIAPIYDNIFKQEVINTLDKIQFDKYIRYLVGKNLGRLNNYIKLISWYENQVIHKLLYRGLKDSRIRSKIYGTQFFGFVNTWLNLTPLETERKIDVVPDVILTKGIRYIPKDTSLNYSLGVATREKYVFEVKIKPADLLQRKEILIILTYNIKESARIIGIVSSNNRLAKQKIKVKLHPNHQLHNPFKLPKKWEFVAGDLRKLCRNVKIVISGGTGAALESACIGCSVILVGHPNRPTANPFPAYDRGKIWDIAYTSEDLNKITDKMNQYRLNNTAEYYKKSLELRNRSFNPPTDKKLKQIFEL